MLIAPQPTPLVMAAGFSGSAPAPAPSGPDWTNIDVVLLPARTDLLFQDLAGTTPVTTDGQTVAAVRHPNSGLICLLAPTLGRGFIWRAGSGKPYVEPSADAAGSYLTFDPGADHAILHVQIAVRHVSFVNNGRIIAPYGTKVAAFLVQKTATERTEFWCGGNTMYSGTLATATNYIEEFATTNSSAPVASPSMPNGYGGKWTNNVASADVAGATTPGVENPRGFSIGGSTSGNVTGAFGGPRADMRIYGLWGDRDIQAASQTTLYTYLQSLLP